MAKSKNENSQMEMVFYLQDGKPAYDQYTKETCNKQAKAYRYIWTYHLHYIQTSKLFEEFRKTYELFRSMHQNSAWQSE